MMRRFEELVVRLLRVPPEPDPPPGHDVRVFRAAPNYLRYSLFSWAIGQAFAVFGLIGALVGLQVLSGKIPAAAVRVAHFLELLAWVGFVFQFFFSLSVLRLNYSMRWYMVTDRSLRIREGIRNVREKTMTFANIQNMSVRQGPLQRLLGIADLEVRSAGGGGEAKSQSSSEQAASDPLHTAYFRGVDNAGEIRELILSAVRRQKDSGLGDPDEERHEESVAEEGDLLTAARELAFEARMLRAAVSSAD